MNAQVLAKEVLGESFGKYQAGLGYLTKKNKKRKKKGISQTVNIPQNTIKSISKKMKRIWHNQYSRWGHPPEHQWLDKEGISH